LSCFKSELEEPQDGRMFGTTLRDDPVDAIPKRFGEADTGRVIYGHVSPYTESVCRDDRFVVCRHDYRSQ